MKKIIFLLAFVSLLNHFSFSQDSLNVNLLFHWDDNTLPGSSAYNNAYNEIWGFVHDNREYAVIGSTMGTHIFDVTDPANAVQADFVPGGTQGPVIIHRDFHDYNGYLYMVADEGNSSTLQIADLSYLPDSVQVVYDSNVLIKTAHNIFIDTTTARMFVGGGLPNHFWELSIYSLANPIQPVFIKSYNSAGYIHDMYVRNDTAFLNAGNNGLYIVDFTNVQNPVTINTLTNYPFSGYNHSGWLNEPGNIYVLADENWGLPLKVIDVSDFNNMTVLSTLSSGIASSSIPHNVIIKDNFAYVSYYYDGLYIFDISDPTNPVIAGFYDTSTEPNSFNYKGAWGVYPYLPSGNVLISDMQNGLYVFDVSSAIITSLQENLNSERIKIYPNPASEKLNIRLPELAGSNINVEILNISGQKVLRENYISAKNQLLEINLSAFNPGFYLVNIYSDKINTSQKLIIR